MTTQSATPVSLITGFLGAGKTTLLKHLLEADHGVRLGVIVNDFGAINIDAELIREVQGEAQMVRLTNGCICCSVRGDLLETVVQLAAQTDAPDQIIIEASGISDPSQLTQTFTLPELAHIARLDSVAAVVDAAEFGALRDGNAELACQQIKEADLVLMNKTDLITRAEWVSVRERIAGLAPDAVVLETRYCNISPELLLGTVAESKQIHTWRREHVAQDGCGHHDHHSLYETFSWEQDAPFDLKKLRDALDRMPVTILRVKGFVHLVQAPQECCTLHRVGRRASLTRGGPWVEAPRTRLVFIAEGRPGIREEVYSLLQDAFSDEVRELCP
ncbi:MAG: GTP-binding protein [Burkholderiales bacterium]|nr:GTP-binding protein [Burkholderiales bacterium]